MTPQPFLLAGKDRPTVKFRIAALLAVTLLGGCRTAGDLTDENGGGVFAVRNTCPIAGVPAATGDITLFNPTGSTDSRAIDVTATITDVRATCQDGGNEVVSTATFTVVALRRHAGPARQVVLPYFDVVLQGGSQVVAKRIGQAVINFAPGDVHGWVRVQASVRVNRAAATLPANVREILTRQRKPGESEAALDPLADPAIRDAVAKATFEHLVGFQLSEEQLRYNATR
jgi:hypothetical protein